MSNPMWRLSLAYALLGVHLFLLAACSAPNIKMPDTLPHIVKEYKHIALYASVPGLQGTKIVLKEGDIFSILATGEVDLCPTSATCPYNDLPPVGLHFYARIGKKRLFPPFGVMFKANDEGELFLGVREGPTDNDGEPLRPQVYVDNRGYYSVDVIVWTNEDYAQVADFFQAMKAKYPENDAVLRALAEASRYRDLYVSRVQTSKEIEETKKEINQLTDASALPTPQIAKTLPEDATAPTKEEASKEERIVHLEDRLAKLMEQLKHLEETRRSLEAEKGKSDLLVKELRERERKETELVSRLTGGRGTPPVIVVASPQDGALAERNFANLSGVAEDDQGLSELEIFINNRPLAKEFEADRSRGKEGYPRRLEFRRRIPLDRGENQIRVKATDSDGLVSETTLTVHHAPTPTNVWAVVIGINRYRSLPQLKYARSDAEAFYDQLVRLNRIPQENITLLLDEQADLTTLRSVLGTQLKGKAGREDMVIIYFAGHGATEKDAMSPDGDGLEKYLLPFDANVRDLYASALPMREIAYILNRITAERLVFIVDSCYSGASGGRTVSSPGMRANISDAFLDRVAAGKGRVIMTASAANEVSPEKDQLKHGVFTYFLLEGLRGKADTDQDGAVTVDEVYRHVSKEVPRATGQEQHPVKKGSLEGDLVLSVRRAGSD